MQAHVLKINDGGNVYSKQWTCNFDWYWLYSILSMALNRQHYFSGIISYSDLPLNAIIVIEHCSHKKVNIKNM